LVSFSTPEPEYPNSGNQVNRAALLGILILGPGCGGTALILVGIVAMVRTRKGKQLGQNLPSKKVAQKIKVNYSQYKSSPQEIPSSGTSVRTKRKKHSLSHQPDPLESQGDSGQNEGLNICPNCGTMQKVNAQFCRQCGAALTTTETQRRCTYCGSEIKTRSRFCPQCGKPIERNELA
jgi:predicted RNA-binding Zn-ribbon protein involved in translation (DUF1610 family)